MYTLTYCRSRSCKLSFGKDQERGKHLPHVFKRLFYSRPRGENKAYNSCEVLHHPWKHANKKPEQKCHDHWNQPFQLDDYLAQLLGSPTKFCTPSILSTFLPTPLTRHFRTEYLTIEALATKQAQLLITLLTVADGQGAMMEAQLPVST